MHAETETLDEGASSAPADPRHLQRGTAPGGRQLRKRYSAVERVPSVHHIALALLAKSYAGGADTGIGSKRDKATDVSRGPHKAKVAGYFILSFTVLLCQTCALNAVITTLLSMPCEPSGDAARVTYDGSFVKLSSSDCSYGQYCASPFSAAAYGTALDPFTSPLPKSYSACEDCGGCVKRIAKVLYALETGEVEAEDAMVKISKNEALKNVGMNVASDIEAACEDVCWEGLGTSEERCFRSFGFRGLNAFVLILCTFVCSLFIVQEERECLIGDIVLDRAGLTYWAPKSRRSGSWALRSILVLFQAVRRYCLSVQTAVATGLLLVLSDNSKDFILDSMSVIFIVEIDNVIFRTLYTTSEEIRFLESTSVELDTGSGRLLHWSKLLRGLGLSVALLWGVIEGKVYGIADGLGGCMATGPSDISQFLMFMMFLVQGITTILLLWLAEFQLLGADKSFFKRFVHVIKASIGGVLYAVAACVGSAFILSYPVQGFVAVFAFVGFLGLVGGVLGLLKTGAGAAVAGAAGAAGSVSRRYSTQISQSGAAAAVQMTPAAAGLVDLTAKLGGGLEAADAVDLEAANGSADHAEAAMRVSDASYHEEVMGGARENGLQM